MSEAESRDRPDLVADTTVAALTLHLHSLERYCEEAWLWRQLEQVEDDAESRGPNILVLPRVL